MIKLVIFDMDGLLIDSERTMWSVNEQKAGKLLGYDVPEFLIRKIIGGSNDESRKAFCEYFGKNFPIDEFYRLVFKFNQESLDHNEVPLRPGAIPLLEYLQKQHIKIALGTSSPIGYTREILSNLKIIQYFDHITTRDDVAHGKPYPDIYLHCKHHYNFLDEEIIVLEDAHNGILSANAAGLKTILIEDMSILTDDDRKNAILVGQSLLDVIDYLEKHNH